MSRIISYPEIHKSHGRGFDLDFRLPEDYKEWVKKITLNIQETFKKEFLEIQKRFDLDTKNDYYPAVFWNKEEGLSSIALGSDCACLSLKNPGFHNIDTIQEAFAATQMLCYYLNTLQILQE